MENISIIRDNEKVPLDYFDGGPLKDIPYRVGFERTLNIISDNPSFITINDVLIFNSIDEVEALIDNKKYLYQVNVVNKNGQTKHGCTLEVKFIKGGVITGLNNIINFNSNFYYDIKGNISKYPFKGINIYKGKKILR